MTKAQAREILPNVTVKLARKTYRAQTGGRFNDFATVYVKHEDGLHMTYEFSWESIARSINLNKPLEV